MYLKTIAGAAALVALLASPALSQTAGQSAAAAAKSGADTMGMKGASGTKMKTQRHQRSHMGTTTNQRAVWRGDRYVGPGAVAAGVVGGTVGTAAAIAAAPFGMWNNSYAYYGGGYAPGTAPAIAPAPRWGSSYAYYGGGYAPPAQPAQAFMFDDNGPKCKFGTLTTINGVKYRCQ